MRKEVILLIKLKFVLLTFFLSSFVSAQQDCYNDTHSVMGDDAWLSCNISANPNPIRAGGYWIMYNFGQAYNLTSTHFWNYNEAGQQNNGIRNCIIDYSIDGDNWYYATLFEIAQATGNNYSGSSGPDLSGISTQYVLLTAVDTWGGNCAGLSEVRFDLGTQCPSILDFENTTLNTSEFHAQQQIISSGEVETNHQVWFNAGEIISLESGFSVPNNTEFKAYINQCSQNLLYTDYLGAGHNIDRPRF